jgi:hypothetical protein
MAFKPWTSFLLLFTLILLDRVWNSWHNLMHKDSQSLVHLLDSIQLPFSYSSYVPFIYLICCMSVGLHELIIHPSSFAILHAESGIPNTGLVH